MSLEPEYAVVILHLLMINFAYLYWYPKANAFDLRTLSLYDAILSLTTLLIVGLFFYDTGVVFELLGWQTNWFWFTLVTGVVIEAPYALWYLKRHNIT